MAVKVEHDNWGELLDKLRGQRPQCANLYGLLKNAFNGTWNYHEFWVDQWPDFEAVVAVPIPSQCDSFSRRYQHFQSTNASRIKTLLSHPGIIDWTMPLKFDCPLDMTEMVKAISPQNAELVRLHECSTYIVKQDTLNPVPIPHGMGFRRLKLEDVPTIAHNYSHRYAGKEVSDYICRLVNCNLPNFCLHLPDETMVGYVLTDFRNCIAFLNVEPHFRRKGFAKVLISRIAEEHLKKERFAIAGAHITNKESRAVLIKCGFRCVTESEYCIMDFQPKV